MPALAWRSVGLGWGCCLLAACAVLRPVAPGRLADGSFSPAAPAAASYGPNPAYSCHAAGLLQLLGNELSAQGPTTAVADGQLCALAETFVEWGDAAPPPAYVVDFVGWHLGLTTPPTLRSVVSVVPSEEPAELAVRVAEVLSPFVKKATRPHYGVATLRLSKGSTRVVLTMQDLSAEVTSAPRQLAAGATAPLRGRLATEVKQHRVLVSDAQGRLQPGVPSSGQDFTGELSCGDAPGQMEVEVRGGEPERSLLAFPVQCGSAAPTAVRLQVGSDWPKDLAEQGKKVLEQINLARARAHLPALTWDDAVAGVARSSAELLRDNESRGVGTAPDPRPLLQQADVMSQVVLENPGQAMSAEEAQRQFARSPALRANFMSAEVTHAGVGVVLGPSIDGRDSVFVVELFVHQKAPLDVAATRAELLRRIADKRTGAHAPLFTSDPTMDAAAQKYAAALASSRGTLSDADGNELLAPLRKTFKSLNLLTGVKVDPLSFAEEQGVVTDRGQFIGLGLALGTHPNLGKNSMYVVVVLGTRR